jgi:hypothetical protein
MFRAIGDGTAVEEVVVPMRLICLLFALSGCLVTLPPSRTELAHVSTPGGGRTRAAIGMHLASAVPAAKTRVEVGTGVLYESSTWKDGRDSHGETGAYADAGAAVLRNQYGRMLVSARGERHWRGDTKAVAKLRVDLELFSHTKGSGFSGDSSGVFAGTWYGMKGFGLFSEVGRAFGEPGHPEADGWVASVGLTVRAPAVVGLLIPLPKSGGGGDSRSSGSSGLSGSLNGKH